MKKFTLFIFLSSIIFLYTLTLESAPQDIATCTQFKERILQAKTAIILFYAPWCNKSTEMKKYLHKISSQYPHISMITIDATKQELEPILNFYGISYIPALVSKEELNMDTQHLIKHVHAIHNITPPRSSCAAQKRTKSKRCWYSSHTQSRSQKTISKKNKKVVHRSNITRKRCS